MVGERSRLSIFSSSFNNTGTASHETTRQRTEESQALLLQTFPHGMLQLEIICRTGEQCFQELAFVVGYTVNEKAPTLTITQRKLYFHPPFGYISRIHIAITGNDYMVNMLATKFQSGTVSSNAEVYKLCEMFSTVSLQILPRN